MSPLEAEQHVKTIYSDAELFLLVKFGYIIIHNTFPNGKFLCYSPQPTRDMAWLLAAEELDHRILEKFEQ
jgi:hypothetical protein